MNTIQAVLQQTIAEKRLSAREAARQLGVAHTTVLRILKGEPADVDTIEKVAKWTGVSLSTLLDSKDSDDLASKIAAIIEREPDLAKALDEAMSRILAGKMKPEVLADLVSYI